MWNHNLAISLLRKHKLANKKPLNDNELEIQLDLQQMFSECNFPCRLIWRYLEARRERNTSETPIAQPLIKRAMSASKARRHSSNSSTDVEFSAVYSYLGWYQMSATEKIRVNRFGLPAQLVVELSSVMGVPKVTLINALRLSRATVNRNATPQAALAR
ncbi:hypothetical protein ABT364_05715 [Massilia sp. SR12]